MFFSYLEHDWPGSMGHRDLSLIKGYHAVGMRTVFSKLNTEVEMGR